MGNGSGAVAVIGAGAAGLAAASRLWQAGHTVTVFERRPTVGGRMRTDQLEDVCFDAGAQLVSGHYRSFLELARLLDAESELVRSPGRDAVWRKGRAQPLRYGSVASMVTSGALPTALKFRLGATYLPFLARHARLDLHDLANTGGAALDTESIAAWGGRELGSDFVELLAYPLLGAYYGSAPEETSSALYHGLARAGMDVSLYGARNGFGVLAARMAQRLSARGVALRLETAIERVEPLNRSVVLHRPQGAERYDAVILAVPAAEARKLLPDNRVGGWLERVRQAPTCTLTLALDRPSAADFFGLSLPRAERTEVVALCIQERKVDGLVPAGRGAIVIMPAPERAAALVSQSPAQVLDRVLPVVERVLPGTRSAVLRARLTTFPEGNPVFYPGYVRHLQTMRPELLPGGVALAGDYLVAPTIEGAVRSGRAAAVQIEAWLNPR
jgi:oxygen-dependent protoporphyrinogen oxidase